jgi:hypothetical protein
MTSMKPNQTPVTNSYEPIVRILDDRDIFCDEPEDMEPIQIGEKNDSNPYGNSHKLWKTQQTASPKISNRRRPRFNLPGTPDS